MKKIPDRYFLLRMALLLCFTLYCSVSFAQEKKGTIERSKSSTSVNGKKYYLHTVEKGQTLYAISKAYDVTVSDILSENPDAVDGIKPGQVLRIPFGGKEKKKKKDKEEEQTDFYNYKVDKGETVYSIAKKENVSENEIKKLNPSIEKDGLREGEEIKIPGVKKTIVGDEGKNSATLSSGHGSKDVTDNSALSVPVVANENNFNVALFLPFYLSATPYIETEKIKKGLEDFPERSRIAVEFYQGAMMALDSLKKKGISVNLFVYDTGADSTGQVDISKMPELKTMNLIIGPLYTASFSSMSKFAKLNSIPIVSPLSQNNKILLGNPFISKCVPSTLTETERLSDFISKKYADQNVILLSNNNPKDLVYTNSVKEKLNMAMSQKHAADSVKMATSLKAISDDLQQDKINIIVVTGTSPSYVTDILSKLNKMKEDEKGRDSIIVFGMHSWSSIESIDVEYLTNLNVHIPSGSFIDYNDGLVKKFISDYRNRYNAEPGEYVYDGYDVLAFYISSLRELGTKSMQQDLPLEKWKGLHMNFEMIRSSPESGYENAGVFVLCYDHYSLVKAE